MRSHSSWVRGDQGTLPLENLQQWISARRRMAYICWWIQLNFQVNCGFIDPSFLLTDTARSTSRFRISNRGYCSSETLVYFFTALSSVEISRRGLKAPHE